MNLKVCQVKQWRDRMGIETGYSMLTLVSGFKRLRGRVWAYLEAHLSFAVVASNLLLQWHGFTPDENGFIPLSIAEFSL